jgi:hypothetical protein
MVAMGRVDDDTTRLNAVAEHVQMIGEAADTRLDSGRCLDVPERDMDRCCHCCRSSLGVGPG